MSAALAAISPTPGPGTGPPGPSRARPRARPPAGASMAFDQATGDMVLFGGNNSIGCLMCIRTTGGNLSDTWTWDGSTWAQQTPTTSPANRSGAPMAFDPVTGDLVLFGGLFGGGNESIGEFSDTWTYGYPAGVTDTWAPQSPATSPSASQYASMAFDPATGDIVLFGGFSSASGPETWDGSTWAQLSPTTSPECAEASMAFDPATGDIVLFGGCGVEGDIPETWTWDGSTWAQLSPATSPSPRDDASMAFDPATGDLVLFGGFGYRSGYLSDTWTWDGSTWAEQNPAMSPPAREGASMAFDPATGDLVLFGGFNSLLQGSLSDTWTWDGSTWAQLSPATSPLARNDATMAFDPATGALVLFGGANSTSGYLSDTWTWDGSTWAQLSPAMSPPARAHASMAFDPATGDLVLFGGATFFGAANSTGLLSDTWNWGLVEQAPPVFTVDSPPLTATAGQLYSYNFAASRLSGADIRPGQRGSFVVVHQCLDGGTLGDGAGGDDLVQLQRHRHQLCRWPGQGRPVHCHGQPGRPDRLAGVHRLTQLLKQWGHHRGEPSMPNLLWDS